MSPPLNPRVWWDLHLRKARGEALSDEEQRLYDAEVARQDREAAPLHIGLESLRKMRQEVEILRQSSSRLHDRLAELEEEIQSTERSLSPETRAFLGVAE
jgi:hypothetical protein